MPQRRPIAPTRARASTPRNRINEQPSRPLRLTAGTYIVHTQPGLESVAMAEIITRCDGARELGRRVVAGRAGLALFSASLIAGLSSLRSAEDLFAVIGYRHGLASDRAALDRIRAVAREAPYIDAALDARVILTPGSRAGRRLKFRVIARMTGDHEFLRTELKRAVERGVEERGDHAWRLTEGEADVEFWATLFDNELILALRLSDDRLRQRDYKVAHIPGSLRPAVAAALGLLSDPKPEDIVLDPFCGAGTVLIERAHLGRYAKLIGGDLDDQALDAARANIGPRYQPLELHRWDAVAIPLPDHSVSRVITNLPWGVKHGTHAENRRLYPRLFAEFARLVRPDGKIVMLTGETRLMNDLRRGGPLRIERMNRVSILGAAAAIYVCRPSAGAVFA